MEEKKFLDFIRSMSQHLVKVMQQSDLQTGSG